MGRGMASVKPMSIVGSDRTGSGMLKLNENVGNWHKLT